METLHEEALAAAGIRADGTIDINAALRSLLEGLLNAAMDEQASELGVARNGYRERSLDTCVGTVTLRIPKLREGSYFPDDLVSRWSRTDTALASAICDMWVAGISTRKVEEVAAEMGVESMSRSRVSRLCAGLDEEVSEMRSADLSAEPWPYLWLDATYVPCREAGAARSTALVTAVACSLSGRRRVVGLECVDAESYLSWRDFLLGLRRRGLSGVRLVTSDATRGWPAPSARCSPAPPGSAAWRTSSATSGTAAAGATWATPPSPRSRPPCRSATRRSRARATEGRAGCSPPPTPAAPSSSRTRSPPPLAYLGFPREHAVWVRTNNVCERMNCEIKRRTRVVQVFPSRDSLVRLVGAVCCDQNDAWLSATNFIDRRTLEPGYEREPLPEEPGGAERVARVVEEAFDRRLRAA